MKFSKDSYIILKKLSSNTASHEELNLLIKISSRIARSYIIKNYFRMSRLYEYFEANQEELALDAIAGLYCRDKDNVNYNIINSFHSWKPPVKSEEEAFFFLNKMIASAVEQYLSEMLREADPAFSKIFNSLNYTIRKMGYRKIEYTGCKYIARKDEYAFDKKFVDTEFFESMPIDIFSGREKYLARLFDYLDINGFAPAIPLNHLVSRLKRIYLSEPLQAVSDSLSDNLTLTELINNTLEEMKIFLKEKYLDKGKISAEEAEYFVSALQDISYDLRDGGITPGIHLYLEKYMPGLRGHKMYDKYHNILEYLLKIMKKNISDRIAVDKFSE